MQSQCRLSSERLAVFCLEMGMLVRSGVDLSAALNALGADAASSLERDLYQSIHNKWKQVLPFLRHWQQPVLFLIRWYG